MPVKREKVRDTRSVGGWSLFRYRVGRAKQWLSICKHTLPVTARGNKSITLVVGLFSKHPEAYALSGEEKKNCPGMCVAIGKWLYSPTGCTTYSMFLSDRDTGSVPRVCQGVYDVFEAVQKFTS